jgi:predicted kinase
MITEKNKLYILCGPSGSGKSTKAKKLAPDCCIFEADKFWLNCVGEYLFVPTKIAKAHQWCQSETRKAMEQGKSRIVVSNTSLTPKERQPYIKLAKEFDYEPILTFSESPWFIDVRPRLIDKSFTNGDIQLFVEKSTHGVPFDSMKRMFERYDETFEV